MIWVARVTQDHRDDFVATLRDFGCGLSQLGVSLTWGEVVSLVKVAAGDPSTRLGAALAGWAYPASMADLAMIAFAAGKSADQVMPGQLGARMREQSITDEERAVATANLARVSAFRDRPEFDIG